MAVCPLPAGGTTDSDRADVKTRPRPAVSGTYATLLATVVMAIIGVFGLWAREGWLFSSLGPTVFIQAVTPNLPAARLWNTLAGHAIGVAAGFGALFLFRAQHDPAAMATGVLTFGRVAATALAIGATVAAQFLAKAQHPPAAATTMLLTLGGLKPDWHTVMVIAVGVGLVAGLGELARWMPPETKER